jgi:ubiquinone biosynthesis protein COQ9
VTSYYWQIFVLELHQLTSPQTAAGFLSDLLSTTTQAARSINEIGIFANYIFRSWKGIIRNGTGTL